MAVRSSLTMATVLLIGATFAAHAADDFWTLKEKGELDGKPEVAYAHYFDTFRTMEPTVFCHVGNLACAEAGERNATPEQLAEVRQTIEMMREQLYFHDIVLKSADVTGDEATLNYTARGNDGGVVNGTVRMEKRTYRHWRLVEQAWIPQSGK